MLRAQRGVAEDVPPVQGSATVAAKPLSRNNRFATRCTSSAVTDSMLFRISSSEKWRPK
jgi:hypothetical protein